jgi:hypothetical protein
MFFGEQVTQWETDGKRNAANGAEALTLPGLNPIILRPTHAGSLCRCVHIREAGLAVLND